MAELLKGAPAAAALTEELNRRAEKLKERGVQPALAILRVGERPADLAYERNAEKRCEKCGIAVKKVTLPEGAGKAEILSAVRGINEDTGIHGCLMLRPLPDRETEQAAAETLLPEKDVDCMTPRSAASLFMGKGPGFPPCTAEACIALLDYYGEEIAGKRVTVVGRSLVIGKPVSLLLQQRNATVTMCHTGTRDLAGACRQAEILVAAAGKMGVIGTHYVSPDQVIVDVGINVDEKGALKGDVNFDEAEPVVRALTPVPGGVGSMTTAILAKHVIKAAEKAAEAGA